MIHVGGARQDKKAMAKGKDEEGDDGAAAAATAAPPVSKIFLLISSFLPSPYLALTTSVLLHLLLLLPFSLLLVVSVILMMEMVLESGQMVLSVPRNKSRETCISRWKILMRWLPVKGLF